MNPLYPLVAERADWRCEHCLAPEQIFNSAFEVDHILPRSVGGQNISENLALACEACNQFKSDAQPGIDRETGLSEPLFHPRLHKWDEHFSFDAESGQIVGLSSIGRATATRLKLNSDFQVRARQHWQRLGLYP